MQHFQAGDRTAFDTLFARHVAPVRAYLARSSGSAAAADDLTQQTFLSLVRAQDRYRPSLRFKPWLYAIATNAARDWRRRQHERVSATGELPDSPAEGTEPRDLGLERAVRTALDSLPDAQREAILLHRFEGLSFAEIAELAQVTESAVKVRAHRGYERLRSLLAEVYRP